MHVCANLSCPRTSYYPPLPPLVPAVHCLFRWDSPSCAYFAYAMQCNVHAISCPLLFYTCSENTAFNTRPATDPRAAATNSSNASLPSPAQPRHAHPRAPPVDDPGYHMPDGQPTHIGTQGYAVPLTTAGNGDYAETETDQRPLAGACALVYAGYHQKFCSLSPFLGPPPPPPSLSRSRAHVHTHTHTHIHTHTHTYTHAHKQTIQLYFSLCSYLMVYLQTRQIGTGHYVDDSGQNGQGIVQCMHDARCVAMACRGKDVLTADHTGVNPAGMPLCLQRTMRTVTTDCLRPQPRPSTTPQAQVEGSTTANHCRKPQQPLHDHLQIPVPAVVLAREPSGMWPRRCASLHQCSCS